MSKMGLSGLKVRWQQGCNPRDSRGNVLPCLQLLEAACLAWLWAPSFTFRAGHAITPASASITSLSLTTIPLPPSFPYKDTCNNVGPSRDYHSIS